jgi:hypothetical protein
VLNVIQRGDEGPSASFTVRMSGEGVGGSSVATP